MKVDVHTADTLREMVRYIADDRKIARYLGIDERLVRAARGYVPRGRRMATAASDQRVHAGADDIVAARKAAERGSARLLAALEGAA